MEFIHKSVLLEECLEMLNCSPGGTFVDCTFGGGGHSQKILEAILPGGLLIGIDQDEAAICNGYKRLEPFSGHLQLVQDNFYNIQNIIQDQNIHQVDGLLYDLGVSSYQLDNPDRGFSYQADAPLDMRMNQNQRLTAEDIVNNYSSEDLIRIIKEYGEERWTKRIVEFIVKFRQERTIRTTGELVDIIKRAIPAGARRNGPHPAKRTFQAIRIAVNQELKILEKAIEDGVSVLKPGGRICIISFHSLEDRIVKQTFQRLAKGCTCPPGLPVCVCNGKPSVKIVTSKPILPAQKEIELNPRSRSAKLRVAEKV